MSLDIFKQYATDEVLENQGTWFPLGKGAKLLIARSGNKAFSKLFNRLFQANRKVLEAEDEAAEAKSDEILIDVMSKTILLGWEGIDFKGKPLTYSEANAKLLLAVKDFRRQVSAFSEDMSAYLHKEETAQGEA